MHVHHDSASGDVTIENHFGEVGNLEWGYLESGGRCRSETSGLVSAAYKFVHGQVHGVDPSNPSLDPSFISKFNNLVPVLWEASMQTPRPAAYELLEALIAKRHELQLHKAEAERQLSAIAELIDVVQESSDAFVAHIDEVATLAGREPYAWEADERTEH